MDDELEPTASATGKDLQTDAGQLVEAVVSAQTDAGATVSFEPFIGYARTAETSEIPEAAGIYYAIYPDEPYLHHYDQPFQVLSGNVVVYNAWDANGFQGSSAAVLIGEPRAPDIEVPLPPDGEPVTIRTTTPGQKVRLTFDVRAQQRIIVEALEVNGGPAECCVASVWLLHSDDTSPNSVQDLRLTGWDLRMRLDTGGRYTLLIDPYLAHQITATITLSITD